MKVLGVDIGGTFTDFVLLDTEDAAIRTGKVLTDPQQPHSVVLKGMQRLLAENKLDAAEIDYVVHGTTLVTNAVIERKGSPTWLITTRGFRDVMEIRREKRYDIYNLDIRVQPPLIPRHMRLELDERMAPDGTVLRKPDRAEVVHLLDALPQGPKAFAIAFLHSYRNGENERLVAGWIREALGEDAAISLSCEVAPEIREYERSSTTAINAYVQPLVARYLDELESALARQGVQSAPMVMLSHGGLARFRVGKQFPVRILESGPAGGAMVAAHVAKALGLQRVLSFDMGGTTAKICIVDDYMPRIVADAEVARLDRFKKGSGLPVMVPMVDLIEIGAGGGSLASCDRMSLLAVGPQSAGAAPGPACYGRGGTEPTVSDSSLLLGYLDPANFLGGEMPLFPELAQAAFQPIAAQLGRSEREVAWAVHATVNQNMVRAAQMHAFDCACDLSEHTMVCFGGAAPIHACRVARELGVKSVVIPVGAGVASALGFLVAPASMDLRRTALISLGAAQPDLQAVSRAYAQMRQEALQALSDVGVTEANGCVTHSFEARFAGQAHALVVDIGRDIREITAAGLAGLFEQKYRTTYGEAPAHSDIEITALLLRLEAASTIDALTGQAAGGVGRAVSAVRRPAWFPELGGMGETAVFRREQLTAGASIAGPAIVQERETTIVVPPGALARRDGHGNIVIDVTGMQPL